MADIGPEVCRRPVFHSLDLLPVVPAIVTSRSSQQIKIVSNFIRYPLITEKGENQSRKTVFVIMSKMKGF